MWLAAVKVKDEKAQAQHDVPPRARLGRGAAVAGVCAADAGLHPPQEQASWVCQCEESVVQRLEQDFKLTLQQQSSLDQWASWLDSVVTQVLKQHAGSPSFPKAARQFLLKWSFYR